MARALLTLIAWSITVLTAPALAQSVAPAAVLSVAERAADWQLARLAEPGAPHDPRGWERAAFWIGLTHLAERAPRYREPILAMGRANRWRPGDMRFSANDHAISQAYLWVARRGAEPAAIAPTRTAFDFVLAHRPRVSLAFHLPPDGDHLAVECVSRWCWCDALFMGPAGWIELSNATGDRRYREYALDEFWASTDFLYDPAERLYYRDSRFFDLRDEHERKLFWSRGNGWVFAGLANIMAALPPKDPGRARIATLFREMAARLKALQKPDGYWPPSLLAPEGSLPETSGTGFFVYGLAWGVRNGLLPRAEYEPAIRRGWAALARAVATDGRVGWVQQVSDRPDKVTESDTQYYGVGALLLAATAVADLKLEDRP
jgi:rhamnogalacturonyl hydrolase YesR